VVQSIGVDLGYAGAEVGADEILEAFKFGLEDYETEVGFWVCVAGLVFYELDLYKRISINGRRFGVKLSCLFAYPLQHMLHQGLGPWLYFWRTPFCHPGPGKCLQVASLLGYRMPIYLGQNIVDVHGEYLRSDIGSTNRMRGPSSI